MKKGNKMPESFCNNRRLVMIERWKDPLFRKQMSEKKLGSNNPNFGKTIPETQKEKLRVAAANRSPEWREKQRSSHNGVKDSDETKKRKSESHTGMKCYNWKGGVTKVYRHIRGHRKYKEWCLAVLKKYNYTDVFTKQRGGRLSCHHVIPVNTLIKMDDITTIAQALECKLIWDVDNGIAIRKSTHDRFHDLYGDNKNIYELTPEQIQELYR